MLKLFVNVKAMLSTCFLFYYEQEVHVYIATLSENPCSDERP